jgi:hypothetical protein
MNLKLAEYSAKWVLKLARRGRDWGIGGHVSKFMSLLYHLARIANDVEKVSIGDPRRIARRMENKYPGRILV